MTASSGLNYAVTKKKCYVSKKFIALLMASTGVITLSALKVFGSSDVTIDTFIAKEKCSLSSDELENLMKLSDRDEGEIFYNYCEYVRETPEYIVLIERYPFEYRIKYHETINSVLKTFYSYENDWDYKIVKDEFLRYNLLPLDDDFELECGDVVRVPLTRTYTINKDNTYVIVRGDTLSSIAERFGVSQELLRRLNGIENCDLIYPNDCLVIPKTKKISSKQN